MPVRRGGAGYRVVALGLSALVSACASGNRSSNPTPDGVQRVTLTPAQTQVMESGVRTMVEHDSGVTIGSVAATRRPGSSSLHVCGFVTPPAADGKPAATMPFYIQIQDKDGKPAAERGQVGSDPTRLGKVNYMCRGASSQ